MIVLTPDGDRHSIGDLEPGYKRIPRANLPRPPLTAVNANFCRAGQLLLASRYWTEPIRMLAESSKQLLELWNDSVAWVINPHHNVRRRRGISCTHRLLNSPPCCWAKGTSE